MIIGPSIISAKGKRPEIPIGTHQSLPEMAEQTGRQQTWKRNSGFFSRLFRVHEQRINDKRRESHGAKERQIL